MGHEQVGISPVPLSTTAQRGVQSLSLKSYPNEVLRANADLPSHYLSGLCANCYYNLPSCAALPRHIPPDIAMNPNGTLDPRLLVRRNLSQPPPNILSMRDALNLAAGIRETNQFRSKPKPHGAVSRRICGRCGKTGHTAIEISNDGQYKCPIRRAETLIPVAQLQLLRAQASAELEALKESQSHGTPATTISGSSSSSNSPSTTCSLPADQFNRNWRIRSLILRRWNQPLPPKRKEHYVEYRQRANQQLPIWKVDYFEVYEAMQEGTEWRMYPYRAGSVRMAQLRAASLRLTGNAEVK